MDQRRQTRRAILKTIGMAGGAIVAGCTALPRLGQTFTGYIDAHCHVWTDDVDKFPLRDGVNKQSLQPSIFTAKQLLSVARPSGVDRVVLISHLHYYGSDQRYMVDCARRYPGVFRIVGALDDRSPDLAEQMKRAMGDQIVGYRITPQLRADRTKRSDPMKWLEEPTMQRQWKIAADLGVAMCPLILTEHLPTLAPMVRRFPQTPCVIDHFGRVDVGQEKELKQLLDLAKYPNVYVKISGFYARGHRKPPHTELIPKITRCVEAFGPQRLMWASDCPYQLLKGNNYHESIGLIKDRIPSLSASDKDWMLRKTAEKVFFV
jgi:predicted TIM-barrel fold metal-dependent hydrolase